MSIWSPRILSVLRITTSLLFIEHGLMKLFHFPVGQPGVTDPLPVLLIAAAIIEIVAGVLLTLGIFTRFAALIALGETAIAYLMAHLPQDFWPGANGGGEAILYCFIFLYLAFAGGGSWSIEDLRKRRA